MARKESDRSKRTGSGKSKPSTKASKPLLRPAARCPAKGIVNHNLMKALAHPLRAKILAILTERVASPNEMAKELDEGLSQVSYHVKVLREYELIEPDHKKPRRGAVEHFYRATTTTIVPPDAWNHLPPAVRESISVDILQEFFDDASTAIEAGIFDDPLGELSWTPLILDPEGAEEVGRLARDFLASVVQTQKEASERLRSANGKKAQKGISATVFLASFPSARNPKEGKKAAAAKTR